MHIDAKTLLGFNGVLGVKASMPALVWNLAKAGPTAKGTNASCRHARKSGQILSYSRSLCGHQNIPKNSWSLAFFHLHRHCRWMLFQREKKEFIHLIVLARFTLQPIYIYACIYHSPLRKNYWNETFTNFYSFIYNYIFIYILLLVSRPW
jgi:hypothetical protein